MDIRFILEGVTVIKRNRRARMDAQTAMDIADSADLPDGAYFAMVGDLTGVDYEDACLMHMENATANGFVQKLPAAHEKALRPFGSLYRHSEFHYSVNLNGRRVADFWPHARVPKYQIKGDPGRAVKGGPLKLAEALGARKNATDKLGRVFSSVLQKFEALVNEYCATEEPAIRREIKIRIDLYKEVLALLRSESEVAK